MAELKIEYISLSKLKPYDKNARKHQKADLATIENSIREFGMCDPIGIWSDKNIVVEGHGRLLALKALGETEAPCIRLDHLTDEQRRAYALAHNKTAEMSEWDFDLLSDELDDILDIDMTDFGFEFDGEEESEEVVEDDYDVELPEEPKAQVGDIYQLGRHRLMCGSSTDSADVAKLMDGTVADMCFTDPPYNCNYGNIKHQKVKVREIENDNMDTESFRAFCTDFTMNIKKNVSGCVYMCAGQGQDGRVMFTVADQLLHNSTTVIWNKDVFTLGRGKYQNKYEPIWFGWVESGKDFTDDRTLTNVWDIKRPKKSELHPTMKPIDLVGTALNHNPKSESVLDLFGGSGTTLIACEQLNRRCFMMELDPKYVDVIINRWETLTGKTAVLINNNEEN